MLRELLGLLDASSGEATRGFHRLYGFCLARVEEARFDQVAFILRELHDVSARAFGADDDHPSRSQKAGDSALDP